MQETVSPAYQFTIPSLADGLPLDCRLYHHLRDFENDSEAPAQKARSKKGAIIAHPYAPLGGSQDDRVVMAVVEQLLEMDFVIVTFNFRGAAGSRGSTSWTGRPERDDYASSVGFLIHYLTRLRFCDASGSYGGGWGGIEQGSDVDGGLHSSSDLPPDGGVDLILGGYSYGSLIVTQLATVPALLQRLTQPSPPGSFSQEIILRAQSLATQTNDTMEDYCSRRGRQRGPSFTHSHKHSTSHHSITYGGRESCSSSMQDSSHDGRRSSDLPARIKTHMHMHRRGSKSTPRTVSGNSLEQPLPPAAQWDPPRVKARYLLISPLLPPLSTFLSFSASSLHLKSPEPHAFIENPTLVVYGNVDGFTSARRARAWCKRLEAKNPDFASFEVEGVGHFWRERGAIRLLSGSIERWVRTHFAGGGSEGHGLSGFGTD